MPGAGPTQSSLCLPLLVYPLAEAPLKAWGSRQTAAEQRDWEGTTGGSGDGRCRQPSSTDGLTLGNHSRSIAWEQPPTAPLQN